MSVSAGYGQIAMKFYGGVWGGNRNNWLIFAGDLEHHANYAYRESGQ